MARRKNWGELTGFLKDLYEKPDRRAIASTAAYIALTRKEGLPDQDIREETARELLNRLSVHNIDTLDEAILAAQEKLGVNG